MIEIPVKDLKTALNGFSKVISKNSSLPALSHIKIAQTGNGVEISATNLDEYASYRIETPANGSTAEMLVPFERLNRILKGISSRDDIKLFPKDGRIALEYPMGQNVAELSLETLPVEEWPPEPKIESPAIQLDEKFKLALKAALDCSSADSSRRIITGACMDVSDSAAHYVVGTDGKHLFSANSFCFDLPNSLIIPNSRFIHWPGFNDDGDWTCNAKNEIGWIKLQSNHWTFITKRIEGDYPKWRQVMPSKSDMNTLVTFNEEAVNMLLEMLPKLPGNDEHNTPVTFSIVGNRLIVLARNKGMEDWTKITVPGASITGPAVSICLNRLFAIKALKLGFREMHLQDSTSPMLFTADGNKLVIMPLRTEDEPAPLQDPSPESIEPTPPAPTEKQLAQPPAINQPPTEEWKPLNPANEVMQKEPENQPTAEDKPAMKTAMQQIDLLKDSLRQTITGLNDVMKTLTQAYREHRTTARELEAIQDSVRSLQKIKIQTQRNS